MKKLLIREPSLIPWRGKFVSGIGRSTIELVKGLLDINDSEIELSLYSTKRNCFLFRLYYDWPVKYYPFPFPHDFANKMTKLEPWARQRIMGYDLLHITDNFDEVQESERFVVTIHDMYRYFKDNRKHSDLNWNRRMFEKVGRLSRGIVTCSEFTKGDIVNVLGVNPDKITVIPWGVDHQLFYPRELRKIECTLKKFNIKGDYFFTCSCGDLRKNTRYVLEAFAQFAKSNNNCQLVVPWHKMPLELKEKYSKLAELGRIRFLDFVGNDDLANLYSGAIATYFVSSFEGFGFPLIESMASGTPVVTCRNSSLTELGGNLALFVREKNVDDIISTMEYFAQHGKGNAEPLIQYAQRFKWRKTAEKYLDFYKKNMD